MSQRQIGIALVLIAAALVVYAALNFGIDAGNKKALVAVAAAGACTTAAAWVLGRMGASGT